MGKNHDSNINNGTIHKPTLLFVEGEKTDKKFFQAFLKFIGKEKEVQIDSYLGKDKLPATLRALTKRPGYSNLKTLMIIRDADQQKAIEVFKSLQDALKESSLSVPSSMATIMDGSPSVGIFILPDCEKEGELEDLCLSSIEDDDKMNCIDQFIDCLIKKGIALKKEAKTRMQAWLFTQDNPEILLGEAAIDKKFDFNHEVFHKLTVTLQAMTDSSSN